MEVNANKFFVLELYQKVQAEKVTCLQCDYIMATCVHRNARAPIFPGRHHTCKTAFPMRNDVFLAYPNVPQHKCYVTEKKRNGEPETESFHNFRRI